MYGICVLLVAFALTAGKPQKIYLWEKELTGLLQGMLVQYDPLTLATIANLNTTIQDTSLSYNSDDNVITGVSAIVVTNFVPPVPGISKAVTFTVELEKVSDHAHSYTLDGILNGKEYSASGAADMTINDLQVTVNFNLDSYAIEPASACIEQGSLSVDLSLESIEANFENADEVNKDLNTRGPELMEHMQEKMNARADEIIKMINANFCKE